MKNKIQDDSQEFFMTNKENNTTAETMTNEETNLSPDTKKIVGARKFFKDLGIPFDPIYKAYRRGRKIPLYQFSSKLFLCPDEFLEWAKNGNLNSNGELNLNSNGDIKNV